MRRHNFQRCNVKERERASRLQKTTKEQQRKLDQTDSGLVKIHYSNLRILFPVRESISTRSTDQSALSFLSLGPRHLNGGEGGREVPFITQPKYSPTFCAWYTGLGTRVYTSSQGQLYPRCAYMRTYTRKFFCMLRVSKHMW